MSDAPSPPSGLSASELGILQQLVLGRKLDRIPRRLYDLKLARSEMLNLLPDQLQNVWTATKAGRKLIADVEAKSE